MADGMGEGLGEPIGSGPEGNADSKADRGTDRLGSGWTWTGKFPLHGHLPAPACHLAFSGGPGVQVLNTSVFPPPKLLSPKGLAGRGLWGGAQGEAHVGTGMASGPGACSDREQAGDFTGDEAEEGTLRSPCSALSIRGPTWGSPGQDEPE